MELGEKKISFGFTKTSKQSNAIKQNAPKKVENVQYIDCLDSKTIVCKTSEGIDVKEKESELIIPLKRNGNNSSQVNIKVERTEESMPKIDSPHLNSTGTTNQTLEEKAAKEILDELNKPTNTNEETKNSNFVILNKPTTKASVESNLEDYEHVPIGDYGMAMLRGMGWKPEKGIGKNEKVVTAEIPQPRPRGLGLGADKLISISSASKTQGSKEEDLKVVKGAFVQVISGSQRGQYGKIEGFNENSGRVFVKLTLQGLSLSLNEYAFRLVPKEEFNKNSRVLNVSKYEEYKKRSDDKGSIDDERWRHRTPTPEDEILQRSKTSSERTRRRSLTPEKKQRRSPTPEKIRHRNKTTEKTQRRSLTPEKKQRRTPTPEKIRHRSKTSTERTRRRSLTPEKKQYRSPTPDEKVWRRNKTSNEKTRYRSSTPDEKKQYRSSTSAKKKRHTSPSHDKKRQRSRTPTKHSRHK